MENTTFAQNNVTQTIVDTINYIYQSILSSIDNNLYSVLDNLIFINSDILNDKNFQNIFGTSTTNGILLISNAFLLGFILYFAVRHLLSHYTFSRVEKPHSFLIKLLLCGLFMNSSYFLITQIIDLFSFTSSAICTLGSNLFSKNICFSELINLMNTNISISGNTVDMFSLDGLLKGTLSLSLLGLIFSYSLRYIFIKILIILSPFAILSASQNGTYLFFKAWIKNLFSLLFIQIIVAIVLVILFSMDYSASDLFVKFVYIGGIFALLKANSFVRDFIGGVSTNISQSVNNFSRFIK